MQAICPKFEKATELLGKRWNSMIIHQLMLGPKRFSELEQEIHVSGRVLSQRLKELEQFGIIKRHVYPDTPVRIEYVLTEMGRSMDPVMKAIEAWSSTWIHL